MPLDNKLCLIGFPLSSNVVHSSGLVDLLDLDALSPKLPFLSILVLLQKCTSFEKLDSHLILHLVLIDSNILRRIGILVRWYEMAHVLVLGSNSLSDGSFKQLVDTIFSKVCKSWVPTQNDGSEALSTAQYHANIQDSFPCESCLLQIHIDQIGIVLDEVLQTFQDFFVVLNESLSFILCLWNDAFHQNVEAHRDMCKLDILLECIDKLLKHLRYELGPANINLL